MPQPQAKQIATDTTNFNGVLSGTETSVQLALEAIDDANVEAFATAGAVGTVPASDGAGALTMSGSVLDADVGGSSLLGHVTRLTATTYDTIKDNIGATTDPGTGDDNMQGYSVGSRWINTTLDREFVALDVTTAAAVWTETTGAGGGGDIHPVVDTTELVKGSVDATKRMRIEVDGLTTATTRVLTMPDADITPVNLAGQLGGTAVSPDVRGVRETGGPTLLSIAAIPDGNFLKRSGTSIVGVSGVLSVTLRVPRPTFLQPKIGPDFLVHPIRATEFTNGITVKAATLQLDEKQAYSVILKHAADPEDATPTTITTIATGAAENQKDITGLSVDVANGRMLLATFPDGIQATIDKAIAASGDDAEEDDGNGATTNLTSGDLEFVDDAGAGVVGMRFTAITVPQSAKIVRAYIQFTATSVQIGSVTIVLQGEDVDNAAIFTATTDNIKDRTLTQATVLWAPANWETIDAATEKERTIDISEIIQEIVDRAGWASGNALSIIANGPDGKRRTAFSFDGSAVKAPVLHIEYTEVEQANLTVFFEPKP